MDDFIGWLWIIIVSCIPALISFFTVRKLRGLLRIFVLGLIIGFPALLLITSVDQFFWHPDPHMLKSPDAGGYLILGITMSAFIIVSALLGIALEAIMAHMARKKSKPDQESVF
jgi:amino acid transporter